MRSDKSGLKGNILVVDDTRDNLRLLNSILTAAGYLVRPVPLASRALAGARSLPPDLILLDIMMPEMDGYAVCEQLKADERTRDIPVIFISALHETFDKVRAFSVGGVDYISKPFQAEEVLARVATHITLRDAQKALEAEIATRKKAEQALQQHTRELTLLNEMSYRLQTCHSEQETYLVVANACKRLVDGSSGCVYLYDGAQETLKQVESWGDTTAEFEQIGADPADLVPSVPSDGGKESDTIVGAYRIGYSSKRRALYCPVRSAEKLVALLGFYFETEPQWPQLIDEKHRILIETVEHYAQAIANVRLREELRQESIHDPLTGLYNRRGMEEVLAREALRAKRKETGVGIVMFDIDHFKLFNDTFGHKAGDVVLQRIGRLVLCSIRGEDIACRYGGEEFVMILPDITLAIAKQRAEELLSKVRALKITFRETELSVTISIGVSMFPSGECAIEECIAAADAALYQAKEGGRDQVVAAS